MFITEEDMFILDMDIHIPSHCYFPYLLYEFDSRNRGRRKRVDKMLARAGHLEVIVEGK